ncbi:defensin-like peptide family protein [Acinetobacter baumannii 299505]|nr:defensin-like peptide family protein [Acinetobacter baumannii 299505]
MLSGEGGNGTFLNGVCRHEHVVSCTMYDTYFLNGVCRHELVL